MTNQQSAEATNNSETTKREGENTQSEPTQTESNVRKQQMVSNEKSLDNVEDSNEVSLGSNELYLTTLPSHDAQGTERTAPLEDTGEISLATLNTAETHEASGVLENPGTSGVVENS